MSMWVMVAAGVFCIGLVAAWPLRRQTLADALGQARKLATPEPLVAYIQAQPAPLRADLWDQALGQLWQRYERELVARTLVQVAPNNDAKIIQYWMKQVLEIEPEIAQAYFTQEFMDVAFKPEIAAQCGRCGSCGCK
jgi:hypothetical protein